MGAQYSKQVDRWKAIAAEKKTLEDLEKNLNWMSGLDPSRIHINKIVWPGTHDSATNKIGIRFISRPFAQTQSLSIYEQLVLGTRLLDIRVQEDRRVCHGILLTYGFDVVVNDIKKFLSETESEIIILEVRTEFVLRGTARGHLVHQDDHVFGKTIAELLPKRVICVWKPRKSPAPKKGSPLWSSGYLKDNWIDTDLPATKFESNMKHLSEQPPVSNMKFFYRVENTVTPQADNPVLCVKPVTGRIHGYARLFLVECFNRGFADRLQVYSTDFIDAGFVDACAGLTKSRIDDEKPQVSDI
ncbi:hypothetical protein MKW92_018070 [Papaver armeniacum]|nr:hypothetical protein MKW92_018070 [Papaver armeniacum]